MTNAACDECGSPMVNTAYPDGSVRLECLDCDE